MSLNCAEIEKVISTLKKNVIIKNFRQTGKNSFIMETYDKESFYKILIETSDRFNHLCILPEDENTRFEKNNPQKKNLRFGQFLNSQFAGSRIKNIYQHELSRIAVFELEKNNLCFKLILRLWGTASNAILADEDNIIIDALKRFPKMNEWPSEEFIFPGKNEKSGTYKVREEFDVQDIN